MEESGEGIGGERVADMGCRGHEEEMAGKGDEELRCGMLSRVEYFYERGDLCLDR